MSCRARRQRKEDPDVRLSKLLSWLLRHGAEKEGLKLDDAGFVSLKEVLRLKQFSKYTLTDILRVVENNDKKRFSVRSRSDSEELDIRANQGHSLPVFEEHLLTPLKPESLPPLLYHGTYASKVESIREFGLHRMNRNHIHFVEGLPGEREVVSGMRKSCDVCVIVDSVRATKAGIQFYRSENGVILTRGNSEGYVPPTCFVSIESLKHRNESHPRIKK